MKSRRRKAKIVTDRDLVVAEMRGLTIFEGNPRAAGGRGTAAGMKITVLGDSTCTPDIGREAACMMINGKHLFDAGCSAFAGD